VGAREALDRSAGTKETLGRNAGMEGAMNMSGGRQRERAAPGTRQGMSGAVETDTQKAAGFDGPHATMDLLGMVLVDAKPDLEDCRKLSSQRGVAVLAVVHDSEAFRGGVQRGDFIVEVNSARIRTLQDLKKELIHHDLHEPMCVFLLSCGGWRFTSLSFVKGF